MNSVIKYFAFSMSLIIVFSLIVNFEKLYHKEIKNKRKNLSFSFCLLIYDKVFINLYGVKMKLNFNELLILNKISVAEHDLLSHEEEVFVKNHIRNAFNEEYQFILKRDMVEHFVNIVPEELIEYESISDLKKELNEEKEKIGKNSDIPIMLSSKKIDEMISILIEENQYCTEAKKRDEVEDFITNLNDIDQKILKDISIEIPNNLLKKITTTKIKNLNNEDNEFIKKNKAFR